MTVDDLLHVFSPWQAMCRWRCVINIMSVPLEEGAAAGGRVGADEEAELVPRGRGCK